MTRSNGSTCSSAPPTASIPAVRRPGNGGAIVARGKQGEDFAALGKQFDDGDSSFRNGAGIGKKHGEIQPAECEEHLFAMKAGDIGTLSRRRMATMCSS